MKFLPAIFLICLSLALSCGGEAEPEDRFSLADYPIDTPLDEALLRSRERSSSESASRALPDSSMLEAEILAEAIQRPHSRSEAADRLFSRWRGEPDKLAFLDVAIWKRNQHERWPELQSMLSLPQLNDTSSAVGLYALGRTARSRADRDKFYHRAEARITELAGVNRSLLKIRLARGLNRNEKRDEAQALLLDGVDEAAQRGGPAMEARFWREIADILRNQGRDAQALHAYRRATELYELADLTDRTLSTRVSFATRLYHLEGSRRAHGLLEEIVELAAVEDLPFSRIAALNRLSSIYQSHDEHERALDMDRQAVALCIDYGDAQQVSRLYLNVADDHMKLAQMDSAWAALSEAERWLGERPTARSAWAVTMETADFWLLKGAYDRADSLILVAEEIRADLPPSDEEIIFLLRRSEFGRVTGRTVLSHDALERARTILPKVVPRMPGVDLEFDVQLENVRLDLETGQFDIARSHLDSAQNDLELNPSSERATRFWNARGSLDDVTGDSDGALAAMDSALSSARRTRLPGTLSRQHLASARLKLQDGDLNSAQAHCDSVSAYLDRDLSLRIRLEHQLVQGRIHGARGKPAEAVGVLRQALRTAGRSMPRDLAVRFRIDLGEALERQGEPERALTALREASRILAAAQNEAGQSELRLAAAGAIEDCYLAQIRLIFAHPELAGDGDPAEMTLLLRQEMLDSGYGRLGLPAVAPSPLTTLVALLDDERSYLWILSNGTVEPRFLPGREEIERKARLLQRSCSAPGRKIAEEAATQLGRWLLDPLKGHWGQGETLVILPDGALHGLPWTLLPWDTGRVLDHGPVVESHDLPRGEFPSSSFGPGSSLLAVGYNGDAGSAEIRLEFAEEEAAAVGALWPGRVELLVGPEARGEVLTLAAGSDYDVIHLSVHASMHQGVSDRAYLRFATSVPGAPALTVQDIRELDLPSDLVFLSCCEASRNAFSRKGPIMDLALAFTEAGARHVVASPVRVSDAASRNFSPRFYEALTAGSAPAEALRETQLMFRDGDSDWTHPYYWANYHIHRSSRN